MRTNLKATGVTLTPEVQSYFDKRMGKVGKLLSGDPTAQLDAELERRMSHGAGEEFRVEITITGTGMHLRGEASEPTLHSAIDVVESQILNELRKSKGKRIDVVRRQALRFKNFLRGFSE